MICVRCKKRPAIVFVQRMEAGQTKQEGYCLTCAKELGIKPVEDLMKQFGVSDKDLEGMEERMASFMEEAGEDGIPGLAALMGQQNPDDASDSEDTPDSPDNFPAGGSATFPFGIGQRGKE